MDEVGRAVGVRHGQVWAVVLEWESPGDGHRIELDSVEDLVDGLADWHPSALYSPARYAIQIELVARHATEALAAAHHRHGRACRQLGIAAWVLVRAEVLTRQELTASQALAGTDVVTSPAVAAGEGPQPSRSEALYQATRALLGATTAGDVRAIVIGFVVEMGGQVALGWNAGASTLALDLSLGEGSLFAVAEPLSVSRELLEASLPPLLADARQVLVAAGCLRGGAATRRPGPVPLS